RDFGDRGLGADPVDSLVHDVLDFHGGPPLQRSAPFRSIIQRIGRDRTSASTAGVLAPPPCLAQIPRSVWVGGSGDTLGLEPCSSCRVRLAGHGSASEDEYVRYLEIPRPSAASDRCCAIPLHIIRGFRCAPFCGAEPWSLGTYAERLCGRPFRCDGIGLAHA